MSYTTNTVAPTSIAILVTVTTLLTLGVSTIIVVFLSVDDGDDHNRNIDCNGKVNDVGELSPSSQNGSKSIHPNEQIVFEDDLNRFPWEPNSTKITGTYIPSSNDPRRPADHNDSTAFSSHPYSFPDPSTKGPIPYQQSGSTWSLQGRHQKQEGRQRTNDSDNNNAGAVTAKAVDQLEFLASMTFANGGIRAPNCPCCY